MPLRRSPVSLAVLLLVISLPTGCVTTPLPAGHRPSAAPLPAERIRYYDYEPLALEERTLSEEPGDGWSCRRLELSPQADPAGAAGLRPIRLDWYKPEKPGRLPAVLISPILAGNDLYIREFARFYAARGLHAVILYRQKEVFSASRPLSDVENHLRESIIQLRRGLDWLEAQDSVDPGRIGAFSISMGAILTSILSAVDPRVRCSVLGLPAGHVAEIIMTSEDKGIRKRRRNYLKENRISPAEALARLKEVIRSEPLDFAAGVDPKRTLMITGLFDRVLGLSRSLDLWRAMGRPRLILLPTGHYTAYFATPVLKIAAYSFLRRRLK